MRAEGQGGLTASRHLVIAGGGIGGLTAALALAQQGWRITLLEKAPQLAAAGAGIQLSPNASRILQTLGVADPLSAQAVTPDAISVTTSRGGEAVRIPLGPDIASRYGAYYWIVHRADLQAALLARIAECDSIELRLGATAIGAVWSGDGVAVRCRSGGDEDDISAAALIGADGVWSAIRKIVAPAAMPVFSHKIAWRSLIETPAGAHHRIQLWLAPDAHIVAYPVSGGRRTNVVAIAAGDADADARAASLPANLAQARLPESLRDLVDRAQGWTGWPLYAVNAPLWRAGRIALLGDAAHAMMPFAAQGAAMAIEDAAVLADALSKRDADVPAALSAYAARRQPRIDRVRAAARQTGAIYHLRGPMALARDIAMGMLGGRRLLQRQHWIYDWRP